MTKVYGIYGYIELIIDIPLGNGRNHIRREFTRGNPQQGAYYKPATYISSDETEQHMIESSPFFGRFIKLYRVCDDNPQTKISENKPFKPATQKSKGTETDMSSSDSKPDLSGENKGNQNDENIHADDSETQHKDEHPEVTTREELLVFLKSHGAKATVLAKDESIKQFIESKNYAFPNLTI